MTTTTTMSQGRDRLCLVVSERCGVKALVKLREQAGLYWLNRVTWPFLSAESSIVSVVHLGEVAVTLCVPTLIEVIGTLLRCQRRIVVRELHSGRVHRRLAPIAMIGWFTEQLRLHLEVVVT